MGTNWGYDKEEEDFLVSSLWSLASLIRQKQSKFNIWQADFIDPTEKPEYGDAFTQSCIHAAKEKRT